MILLCFNTLPGCVGLISFIASLIKHYVVKRSLGAITKLKTAKEAQVAGDHSRP
jgi:hypothetical protein